MNLRSLVCFILLSAAGVAASANAQSYSSNWSTIDGGGGISIASTGAAGRPSFTMTCALGQSSAGFSAGSGFLNQGGFLTAFAKLPLPALIITPSGTGFVIHWPGACPGLHLEATPDLRSGMWTDLGTGLAYGNEQYIPVSGAPAYHYFRLRKACAGGCPQLCREN